MSAPGERRVPHFFILYKFFIHLLLALRLFHHLLLLLPCKWLLQSQFPHQVHSSLFFSKFGDSLHQFLFRSLDRTFFFLQRQFRFFSHYSPMILHPFVNPPCLLSTTLPHCNQSITFTSSFLTQFRYIMIFFFVLFQKSCSSSRVLCCCFTRWTSSEYSS